MAKILAKNGQALVNTTSGKAYKYSGNSGSVTITENGTYDVDGKAEVAVNVSGINTVSSVPSTKSTDIIYNTSDSSYYLWEDIPIKGQIITMELGNAAPAVGTNNQYRVLSITGTTAIVVAMFDQVGSIVFDTTDNDYCDSTLDTYLNTTWYNSLNSTAKSAIVPTNITQYQYTYNYSAFDAATHASFADYSTKTTKSVIGSRNVYALDVEDIETYFNNTFSTSDFWELFWNTRSAPSNYTRPWLRSAEASGTNTAWFANSLFGRTAYDYISPTEGSPSQAARPAFKIDLSKINFTINT